MTLPLHPDNLVPLVAIPVVKHALAELDLPAEAVDRCGSPHEAVARLEGDEHQPIANFERGPAVEMQDGTFDFETNAFHSRAPFVEPDHAPLASFGSLIFIKRPDFPFKEEAPQTALEPKAEVLAPRMSAQLDAVRPDGNVGQFLDVSNAVHPSTPLFLKGKIDDSGLISADGNRLTPVSEVLRKTPILQGIVGVRS